MTTKPTIPDVIDKFRAYFYKPGNDLWGSLHIVLADDNVDDDSVEFCRQHAIEYNDPEGAELAEILLRMSRTQRLKIGDMLSTERYAVGGVAWWEEDRKIAVEIVYLNGLLRDARSKRPLDGSPGDYDGWSWEKEAEFQKNANRLDQLKAIAVHRFVQRAGKGV